MFGESEPDNAVRDNAAGAVARMIMFHPEAIPLNQVHLPILYFEVVLIFCPNFIFNTQPLYQVLPVFLKVLPLKEDKEESIAVYSCICNLVLSSNPQVLRLFFLCP